MKKNHSFLDCIKLLLSFIKVGAFTFGGGYAMIPIIQREVVNKRKWISEEEMLDMIVISESTPGPIAVNAATYVGFKVAGFWGSFFATLGLVLPSFIIIYIISLFYKTFMSWTVVQSIFKGLKVGVVVLLFNAVIKLKKNVKVNLINTILFAFAFIVMVLSLIFSWNIQIGSINISFSLILILLSLTFGAVFYSLFNKGEQK